MVIMSKNIFLAFTGKEIQQSESIFEIQDGYECWNLKKFGLDDFIMALKEKIQPINDHVLDNYKERKDNHIFGITEEKFKECSWGLLIPDSLDDVIGESYAETMFLINLYSPTFLYPIFFATDFGVHRPRNDKLIIQFSWFQNQSQLFKKKEFVSFFKALLPQSQYGTWQLYRSQNWNEEDWRLFVASMLFSGLKDYDNSKDSFGWQRESADMAAILESLFTAGDTQNEEIGYRLRKRVAVLLAPRFPSIENDIKELYKQRSAFVHGSFFAQIAKGSKTAFNSLPTPDINLLYKQKEYVRWALVAYLHLAQCIKSKPTDFGDAEKVIAVLERAIIDIEFRRKITTEAEKVFSWMSEPSFRMV